MAVTVADVLALPLMAEAEVVAGHAHLADQQVRWAAVSRSHSMWASSLSAPRCFRNANTRPVRRISKRTLSAEILSNR